MANAKLTSFIISILVVSMCVSIFALFLTQMGEGYGENEGMTAQDLAVFDKLNSVTNTTKDIQETVGTNVDDNVFDVIGNYFKSGWQSLQLSKQTIDTVAGEDGIIDAAVNQSNMGEGGQVIGNTMIAIVIVLLIIGVIVSVLLKWNL